MFIERELSEDEQFTKEEDTAFMNNAINRVAPVLRLYSSAMEKLVAELISTKNLDGARLREALGL